MTMRGWCSGTAVAATVFFALTAAASAEPQATLATADQNAVETLAIRLLHSPDVKRQEQVTLAQFDAAEPGASAAEREIIANAAHELAYSAALGAANSDPTRPKVVWYETSAHTWFGHTVPGSRWGIDNPDNVYRFVTVDGTSKYEITVHPKQPGPVQYSFLVYDNFDGETGNLKALDIPVAALKDSDIKTAADGSFTVTIDSDAANGRPNHLQSNARAKILLIRNTFNDWASQTPFAVEIHRVGGPAAAQPASEQALAQLAASYLKSGTNTLLVMKNSHTQWKEARDNVLSKPFVRGGGWGFASSGTFKLAADEALVLTLDPSGAKYLSVDLTDPWLVSREHITANGNLNNLQAESSKDGTYTYVISARDPGIRNWLDTGGLRQGSILIRWQALPPGTTSADHAVRKIAVVKLDQLSAALPADATRVSPEQRRRDNQARAASYAHRLNS